MRTVFLGMTMAATFAAAAPAPAAHSYDPYVCSALAAMAGTYGPFHITATGSVWVDVGTQSEKIYSCPPY